MNESDQIQDEAVARAVTYLVAAVLMIVMLLLVGLFLQAALGEHAEVTAQAEKTRLSSTHSPAHIETQFVESIERGLNVVFSSTKLDFTILKLDVGTDHGLSEMHK